MEEPQSAASQPFSYGGSTWLWTINYWPQASENHARLNNTWRLHKLSPAGEHLWMSAPVELAEWVGVGGPLNYAQGPQEPIGRAEIDRQSHTKTPILQSDNLCLFCPTHQGALLCWDLSGDTPSETWRRDHRLPDSSATQRFYLPLSVDSQGRFLCAYREAGWAEISEEVCWMDPADWTPEDGSTKVSMTFPVPAAASSAGLICLNPSTGEEVWRWECPDQGEWRRWQRRTIGEFVELTIPQPGYVDGDGTWLSPKSRGAGWPPGQTPPLSLPGVGDFQQGQVVISGLARHFDGEVMIGIGESAEILRPLSRQTDLAVWPDTWWWRPRSRLYPPVDDVDWLGWSYTAADWRGEPGYYDEIPPHGDWQSTWHSVYWGQQDVIFNGATPIHSLTATCLTTTGATVFGPLSHRDGLDRISRPLVWRAVSADGDHIWTRSLVPYEEGYGVKASAPLAVGDRVHTLIWEYLLWDAEERRAPELVTLDAATGVILKRDPIPIEVWDYTSIPPIRVGTELVSDGQSIWACIGDKMLRYQ